MANSYCYLYASKSAPRVFSAFFKESLTYLSGSICCGDDGLALGAVPKMSGTLGRIIDFGLDFVSLFIGVVLC